MWAEGNRVSFLVDGNVYIHVYVYEEKAIIAVMFYYQGSICTPAFCRVYMCTYVHIRDVHTRCIRMYKDVKKMR
jgi:hypothetical protein